MSERKHSTEVVALHPFTDQDALGWLRAQPGQRVKASAAELGRRWGWDRKRAGRRLDAWAKAGHIKRRGHTVTATTVRDSARDSANDGTNPGTSGGTNGGTDGAVVPVKSQKLAQSRLRQTHSVPVADTLAILRPEPVTKTRTGAPGRHWILGLTSGALGVALASVGLVINTFYAASLGRTTDESLLLAMLGLAIDGGAVILLAVAAKLWQARNPTWSVVAFASWCAFTAISMIATAGFTSQSIGDFAATRGAAIEQAADLRSQRADAIAVAKTAVETVRGARETECKVEGPRCRDRKAVERSALDKLSAAIAMPTATNAPVGAVDPGAHMLAELLRVSEQSIQKARIAGLTIAPATAALFLAFSVMLLGRRRGHD